jgi:signal transduction histidine kinase
MPSTKPVRSSVPVPVLSEASNQALCLDSTLSELSLYQFQVESSCEGSEVARVLERFPAVPGLIVLAQGQFVGIISRQRFLEYLIRPGGTELFLTQPLSVLHSYARTDSLILPDSTPILVAAQQALRRSPSQQAEPIVVQIDAQNYRLLDVHELNIVHWQLRGIETQVRYERSQAQMVQTEKMASLGRLVDGVAHEILDPVGFIWGNLTHVSTYTEQVMQLLATYEALFPPITDALADLQVEIELDYIRQDLPQAIASIRGGAERLKNLAASLQNFCHVDDVYPKPADLHECLDSILLLLKSRLTGEIQIIRNYSHLPPVTCYAGQLSQVFMNILSNAVDALINQAIQRQLANEFKGRSAPGAAIPPPQITITTQVRSRNLAGDTGTGNNAARWVSIRIGDNGPGLSMEQRQQILDSFSIASRSAKETSLAVSYRIITAKHGGKLYVRSCHESEWLEADQPHRGTEFEILLPLV